MLDLLQNVRFNSLWFPYLALVKLMVERLDKCLFLESLSISEEFYSKGRKDRMKITTAHVKGCICMEILWMVLDAVAVSDHTKMGWLPS